MRTPITTDRYVLSLPLAAPAWAQELQPHSLPMLICSHQRITRCRPRCLECRPCISRRSRCRRSTTPSYRSLLPISRQLSSPHSRRISRLSQAQAMRRRPRLMGRSRLLRRRGVITAGSDSMAVIGSWAVMLATDSPRTSVCLLPLDGSLTTSVNPLRKG